MSTTISTKKLTTTVKFAETEIGNIAICVMYNDTRLILKQILPDANIKIGEHCPDKDMKDLPKVVLDFTKAESVDGLINALKLIKQNILNPEPNFALAC